MLLLAVVPTDLPGYAWFFDIWSRDRVVVLGRTRDLARLLRLYLLLPLGTYGVPTLLMGFSFAVLQRAVQDDPETSGRKVGFLQAANVVGNVAGSLVIGLLALNLVGTTGTVRALVLCGLVFALVGIHRFWARSVFGFAAAALLALALFIPGQHDLWNRLHGLEGDDARVTLIEEDASSVVVVKPEQDRWRVVVNGVYHSRLPYGGIHSLLGSLPAMMHIVDSQGRKYSHPALVGGLAASSNIYCLGLQCEPGEVADRWAKAIENPIPPEVVSSGSAQEEVHTGSRLLEHDGLYEFPIPISTPGYDNGPYITGGHWITKDPETGQRNMGHYRAMIKGPAKTGCFVGTPQDMVAHWEKCRKMGRPLEVAIVVGCIPAVAYAAPQKVPPEVDELALAGGLLGYPVPLVKCRTVDLEVPATSEIVLEGIIPTDYLEEEGPFGESTGYVDPRTLRPVVEITGITHRRDPIWVSIISQVTPSESSKVESNGYADADPPLLVTTRLQVGSGSSAHGAPR